MSYLPKHILQILNMTELFQYCRFNVSSIRKKILEHFRCHSRLGEGKHEEQSGLERAQVRTSLINRIKFKNYIHNDNTGFLRVLSKSINHEYTEKEMLHRELVNAGIQYG